MPDIQVTRRFSTLKEWNLAESAGESYEVTPANEAVIHRTIKKVTEDIDGLKMNTAIAALMTLVNELASNGCTRGDLRYLILLLNPFAPHITEELWENLGFAAQTGKMCCQAQWPEFDESKTVASTVDMAVQVNGKLKGTVTVAMDSEQDAVVEAAQDGRAVGHACAAHGVGDADDAVGTFHFPDQPEQRLGQVDAVADGLDVDAVEQIARLDHPGVAQRVAARDARAHRVEVGDAVHSGVVGVDRLVVERRGVAHRHLDAAAGEFADQRRAARQFGREGPAGDQVAAFGEDGVIVLRRGILDVARVLEGVAHLLAQVPPFISIER